MIYNPDEYLTEDGLYEFLLQFLREDEIVRQFKVPGTRYKTDFYIPKYNLVIEFNGFYHYTSTKQQTRDILVEEILEDLKINLLEIPYFIQPFKDLFAKYIPDEDLKNCKFSSYPQGFVDKKAVRPKDFNIDGLILLRNMLYIDKPYLGTSIVDAIAETLDQLDDLCVDNINTMLLAIRGCFGAAKKENLYKLTLSKFKGLS